LNKDYLFIRLFLCYTIFISVQNMGLKRMLHSNWYIRLVSISWIICAISIFVVFKNMEYIVHGQLYYYGLVFSPDWADPYRIYTWLIYIGLGLPLVLSCLSLVSTFLEVEKSPVKESIVTQKPMETQRIYKTETRQINGNAPRRLENGNSSGNECEISCPRCKKVFGKALVMLDFHDGKNQLVSVCPYCNYVLGNTNNEKGTSVYIGTTDKKAIQ
jgi:hypothetical protein